MKHSLILLTLFLLPGCVLLSKPAKDVPLYSVTSPTVISSQPKLTKSLLVDLPVTPLWLEHDRIALRKATLQEDFFAAARWSSPLPNMAQEMIITTLEKTGKLTVFNQRSGLPADYRLVIEIRNFQIEYAETNKPDTVNISFTASLLDNSSQKLHASKNFTSRQNVTQDNLPVIMRTFDKAFAETQTALAGWVLQIMGK
jgi:cholesterol transport system auxiliary component